MRILVAHSHYLSAASGENQVVEDEARLLSDAGHEVTRWEPAPKHEGFADLVRSGSEAIWSRKAVHELRQLARDRGAEVLHCHNLFPKLSPAVLRAAHDDGLGVVMTLHNYRLLCLRADLLRDGATCELCVGRAPWAGVRYACYRDSYPGSAALATSLMLHRALRTFDAPNLYLAVSDFVRDKHIEAGWPGHRIRVKPNFAWPCEPRVGPGSHFLFVGRLSQEKGLANLLRAWRKVDARLVVVGDGPESDQLRTLAPSNVEFTGAVDRAAVTGMLSSARALLLPSVCYEGQPRTILEAFAAGVPVIASRIGALPELVDDGVTGLLADPYRADEWSAAVEALASDERTEAMGANAHARWRHRFSPETAIDDLLGAYETAQKMAKR